MIEEQKVGQVSIISLMSECVHLKGKMGTIAPQFGAEKKQ